MRRYFDWTAVIISFIGFVWLLSMVLRQRMDRTSNSLELHQHEQRRAGIVMFGGMLLMRFPDAAPLSAGWANEVIEAVGLVLMLVGLWRLLSTSAQSGAG